jgi:hypothetical protein
MNTKFQHLLYPKYDLAYLIAPCLEIVSFYPQHQPTSTMLQPSDSLLLQNARATLNPQNAITRSVL